MSKTTEPEIADDHEGSEEEDEEMTLDDALFIIEDLTEQVEALQGQVESVNRGLVSMMTSFTVVLGDVVIATSPSSPQEAKQAALERVQRIVAAMQQQVQLRK